MRLNENRKRLIALIAHHPEYTLGEFADELGVTTGYVSSMIYEFREHSLVVKAPSKVGVKTSNGGRVVEVQHPYRYMLTGKGESLLYSIAEDIQESKKNYMNSIAKRRIYVPPHTCEDKPGTGKSDGGSQ